MKDCTNIFCSYFRNLELLSRQKIFQLEINVQQILRRNQVWNLSTIFQRWCADTIEILFCCHHAFMSTNIPLCPCFYASIMILRDESRWESVQIMIEILVVSFLNWIAFLRPNLCTIKLTTFIIFLWTVRSGETLLIRCNQGAMNLKKCCDFQLRQ